MKKYLRLSNAIYRSINTKTEYDSHASEIYSRIYQNKDLNPIVIPNFDNLDLTLIKNNPRTKHFDVDEINNLSLEIEKLNKEKIELQKKKAYFVEKYIETKVPSADAIEIRKELQSINSQNAQKQNELTRILLSIPNISSHKPNVNWEIMPKNAFVPDCDQKKIKLNDDLNSFTKSFEGFSLRYLKGNLALSKYLLLEDAYDWWIDAGFIAVSLTDISKTPVIKCLGNSLIQTNIALNNSRMSDTIEEQHPSNVHFLKGSASIAAYCSYFLRTQTTSKSLPVKLVTLGNKYDNIDGLVNQTSVISVLLATSTHDGMMRELNEFLDRIKEFYLKHFNFPLIAEYGACDELCEWEAFRYVLNTNQSEKVTVAKISVINEHISRRLMISDTSGKYLHMVYAEVVNFESLLDSVKGNNECVTYNFDLKWMNNFDINKYLY